MKTPEWRHFCVFIVNFEQYSHFFLMFQFLTLSKCLFAGVKEKQIQNKILIFFCHQMNELPLNSLQPGVTYLYPLKTDVLRGV